MSAPQVKIVNAETGEEIVRDATTAEIAQMAIDAAEEQAEIALRVAKTEAKASAESKLTALGLTADEIAALKA
jgi:hypothetical protein